MGISSLLIEHRARRRMGKLIWPLLQGLSIYTGYSAITVLAGAPPTADRRNFEVKAINFGKTVEDMPHNFLNWDKVGFKQHVVDHFTDFLRQTQGTELLTINMYRPNRRPYYTGSARTDDDGGERVVQVIAESAEDFEGADGDEEDLSDDEAEERRLSKASGSGSSSASGAARKDKRVARTGDQETHASSEAKSKKGRGSGSHSQEPRSATHPGQSAALQPKPRPAPRPILAIPADACPQLQAELKALDYDSRKREIDRLNALDGEEAWWEENMAAMCRARERSDPQFRAEQERIRAERRRALERDKAPSAHLAASTPTPSSTTDGPVGTSTAATGASEAPQRSQHTDSTPPRQSTAPPTQVDGHASSPAVTAQSTAAPATPSGDSAIPAQSTPSSNPSEPVLLADQNAMQVDPEPGHSSVGRATDEPEAPGDPASSHSEPPPATRSPSPPATVQPELRQPTLQVPHPRDCVDGSADAGTTARSRWTVSFEDVPLENTWIKPLYDYFISVDVPADRAEAWCQLLYLWIELERLLGFTAIVSMFTLESLVRY